MFYTDKQMSGDIRRDEEQSTRHRAEVLNLPYVDTSQAVKNLFKDVLSTAELESLRIVPLAVDEHNIHFGVTTTTSQQTIAQLKNRFPDHHLIFSLISETGFSEYMHLYNPPAEVHYQDISISNADKVDLAEVSATLAQVRADDMLAYLVKQAYTLKASDIHLECQKSEVRVRFRVDGVLHPVASIAYEKYRQMLSSLAIAANISTGVDEAQTGHINKQYTLASGESVTVNLRVEAVPTAYGMDVVMRLFNLKLEYFKLENLGLNKREYEVVQDVITHPTGMVMVVGPTGSGKTTTLYSVINTLNTPERKIITLEDPVEYFMPGVVQIPVVGELEGEQFAEKLRATLRLDPDVVMIGEIRDKDTAKTALQAALTGHLVLTTYHASSAAAALTRMLDSVGINPLFASAMHLVMAQRLVRRLDDETKQPYQPDPELKRQLQAAVDTFPPNVPKPDLDQITLYKAVKSQKNPFGYAGQVALREQLLMTPGVQKLLRLPPNEITTEALQAEAVREGMITMLHDGLLKAFAGVTTLEEVYRVVG